MNQIVAKMRWYPGDVVAGIKGEDIEQMSLKHGVALSIEEIVGKGASEEGGILREDTMDSAIEEVSQTVVTVSSEDEDRFRSCVREIISRYRAPRTVFALMGSNERGEQIVKELAEENDGWT